MKINPETLFSDVATGKLTWEGQNVLQSIADAAEGGDTGTPGAGILDGWSGNIKRVAEETKTLVQQTSFAGTITKTTTQSGAGTATFTFKVNGVALSGTANDVSTVEQEQNHTTAFVLDDKIEVTMSANSACENAAFTIHYTRS